MTVRYLIKYTKGSDIKFISHLDLMRTIQRVIRRAKLPIEYSKGFNPHMSLSIAQPLSVGVHSVGEYLDAVFVEEIPEEEVINLLNKNTVAGIEFLKAVKVIKKDEKRIPQAMALMDAATYEIRFRLKENSEVNFDSLMDIKEWNMVKKTKSGEKEVDIRTLVKSIKSEVSEGKLKVTALISCGSRENLSPSLLSDFIKANISEIEEDAFVDIKRIEMYALKEEKLIPLEDFFL